MNIGGSYYRIGKRRVLAKDMTDADRKQLEKQQSKAAVKGAAEPNTSAAPANTETEE